MQTAIESKNNNDKSKIKTLFLVHGEYEVQQEFRERLMHKGFKDIQIPAQHSEVKLS